MMNRTLELAQETLRKLGLEAEITAPAQTLGRARIDAGLRIGHGVHGTEFLVQVRKGVRKDTLDAIILALEPLGDQALLIADHLPNDVADALKAHRIAYLDLAGNTWLDRPPMLIWIAGQRRTKPDQRPLGAEGRAFKAGGLPVLLAFLCHPEWVHKPYRELATLAGVAHGTIGNVMAELQEAGYVDEVGGNRRLLQRERLLDQWVEATLRVLRPRTLINRYRADRETDWTTFDPLPHDLVIGGELAAARLTGHLRPEVITLYGRRADPRLILHLGLRPDPAGNIEIRERFWTFQDEPRELAPLPLIYMDLLATGDARCLETARLLKPKIHAGPLP